MQKKDIIRLSKEERNRLREVIRKLKGSGQKVRRARMLLKADADGPAWADESKDRIRGHSAGGRCGIRGPQGAVLEMYAKPYDPAASAAL